MRFRRGKGDKDDASPPPGDDPRPDGPDDDTPPSGHDVPPPSGGDRVEDPTEVLPAGGEPPDPGTREDPGAAGPPDPTARVEEPAKPHGDPLAAPPSAAEREEGPAKVLPPAADSIAAPPPSPAARVGDPVSAAPPPQAGDLVAGAGAAPASCPHCGAATEPGQEICISCGNRLARAYEKPRGSRLPIVLAALGLLLIGGAITFGVAELLSDDESDKPKRVAATPTPAGGATAATGPTAPITPTGPSGASGPSGVTGPSGATGAEPPLPPPATRESPTEPPDQPGTSGNEPASWPSGKTAFTVVLQSATSRSAADAKARQAVRRGIPAGVLRSDDYSSLNPGYWVVFAGQFDSREEAQRAAERYAEQGFGGGYARQVKK